MAFPKTLSGEDTGHLRSGEYGGSPGERPAGSASAVAWGAIAAGAAAAAALSLILLILGMGLGLSSVSPWANSGIGATALGVTTIVWLTATQLVASAMGGYLAGRLRTKWTEVHVDEVYFRDTAHGFLAWAVSSLATAALLSSVIASIVGGGVQAGASVAGGAAVAAAGLAQDEEGGSMAYFVDTLFRREAGTVAAPTTAPTTPPVADIATGTDHEQEAAEIARILMFSNLSRPLAEDDLRHVGQLVARRTGMTPADAQKRVTDTYARAQAQVREAATEAREAADNARKASAYGALWLFVSLLIGAFFASLAATFGGRQRDA